LVAVSLLSTQTQPANAGDGTLFISVDHPEGYDRALFKLWIDADKNGCDTRAEVLIKEAIVKPKKGAKCKLTGGKWISSYDGVAYTDASKLDIDHLVPLAEAWRSGAWQWTNEQREEYANYLEDERALNAVTASVNRSKGDKDIASWLPKKNVCDYLAGWVTVKAHFSLTVDSEEAKVISKYYTSCGLGWTTKQSPTPMASATPTPTMTPAPTPTPSFTPTPIVSVGATPTPSPTPKVTPTLSPTLAPITTKTPTPTPVVTPEATPTQQASTATISPGAFCSPAGAIGKSSAGALYSCKTSPTDTRNRWRP